MKSRKKLKELPSIAILLKKYRQAKDLTQSELGEVLGIKKQQVCDLEKSRRLVSMEMSLKFAKKLGEPVDVWISTALQDQVRRVDLDYVVKIERPR